MNIDIEKLKGAKVTIPIAAVIACVIFVWNISRNFTDFQESVVTDTEMAEIQDSNEEEHDEMNSRISLNDKRLLILEITTGSLGIAAQAEGAGLLREAAKPPSEDAVAPSEEDSE